MQVDRAHHIEHTGSVMEFDMRTEAMPSDMQLPSDNRPYLTGESFTEADLRLFPTLYRHDPVYYVRMKLNGARIVDYPQAYRHPELAGSC